MDYTPDTPDHVPPSEEVQHAEHVAEHRVKVRRAKLKFHAAWWITGFSCYALMFVLYMIEWYWLMPGASMISIFLLVRMSTKGANDYYRAGVEVGLALGSIAAMGSYMHAMAHVRQGEPPCKESVTLRAKIPEVWEDPFVREEIHDTLHDALHGGDDDDDDDEARS